MSRQKGMDAEEIVQTIKRSRLINIVVEGITDRAALFRLLEEGLNRELSDISIIQCGGRSVLLAVFERRAEYERTPTVFIADNDLWLFTKRPGGLDEIIFTTGYSIENDIYKKNIEALLSTAERKYFAKALENVCLYFAYAVFCKKKSIEPALSHSLHPDQILSGDHCLKGNLTPRLPKNMANEFRRFHRGIHSSYTRKLRGHTLIFCLVRFLSKKERDVKHSAASLLAVMMTVNGPSRALQRLVERVVERVKRTNELA